MSIYHHPRIVTDGLVLHLDAANKKSYVEGSSTWYDLSKNKRLATLTDGPTFNSSNSGSLLLDGIDDYISLGAILSFTANFATGTTIEIWSKFVTTKNWARLIDISNGKSTVVLIFARYSNTNKIALEARNSPFTSQGGCYTTNDVISNGTIQHFVGTIGGGTIGGVPSSAAKIYINGISQSLTQFGTHFPYVPDCSSGRTFWMGRSAFTADAYLNNNIYSIRIYNKELSQNEILQNFNATKSRYGL